MLATNSQARGEVVQLQGQEADSLLHSGKDTDVNSHEGRGNTCQSEEAIKKCAD